MMKKILLYALLILLVACPVFPMNTAILSGSGEGGGELCASCNSGTDSSQGGDADRDNAETMTEVCDTGSNPDVLGQKIVLESTTCITGYTITAKD